MTATNLSHSPEELGNPSLAVLDEDSRLIELARLTLYRFFSIAFLNPSSSRWTLLQEPSLLETVHLSMEFLRERSLPTIFAPGELSFEYLDLKHLNKFLLQPREALSQEFQNIFGLLTSQECSPYETDYCPQTFSVYRSHQMADVAGFYRAFGLERSSHFPDRVDHITVECEFMAWLIAKTELAQDQGEEEGLWCCREAQKKFFQEHLFWWVPTFSSLLRKKADSIQIIEDLQTDPQSYQGALAQLVAAFIPIERSFFQIEPSLERVTSSITQEDPPSSCESCTFAESPEHFSPEEEDLYDDQK